MQQEEPKARAKHATPTLTTAKTPQTEKQTAVLVSATDTTIHSRDSGNGATSSSSSTSCNSSNYSSSIAGHKTNMLPLIHELLKTTFRAAAGGSVEGPTFKLPAYRHISIYWSAGRASFFFFVFPLFLLGGFSCRLPLFGRLRNVRTKNWSKTSNFLPRAWRFLSPRF